MRCNDASEIPFGVPDNIRKKCRLRKRPHRLRSLVERRSICEHHRTCLASTDVRQLCPSSTILLTRTLCHEPTDNRNSRIARYGYTFNHALIHQFDRITSGRVNKWHITFESTRDVFVQKQQTGPDTLDSTHHSQSRGGELVAEHIQQWPQVSG